ncbi:TIGR03943 family protein [Actinoplanes sp. NPDC051851]|uniref:TIGR03943 family putative permease subunit n=1 Tax=Actinoplanes sp. NPDC051851 TaxID=3154753 RepID=UPI003421C8A6
MNRLTQAVIMLLLGATVIKATVTDTYLRYVKAGLGPYLLAAGILLAAAALATFWYEIRTARNREAAQAHDHDDHGHDHEHDDGHGHGHGETRVGWLLLLPALAMLMISPPALGSYSANQAGSVGLSAASDYPPLPDGDPVEVTLLDYASRALFDSGKSLTGRNLKLTGFITPGPDGSMMLARIVLTCCAADGRPIKVGLTGVSMDAPADAWVQIEGVYSTQVGTDPVNNAQIAYIEVRGWQEIDEPKQPYV